MAGHRRAGGHCAGLAGRRHERREAGTWVAPLCAPIQPVILLIGSALIFASGGRLMLLTPNPYISRRPQDRLIRYPIG
ncbi:protein of unknown function [Candidatus Promineifilum breve]|uniref:Uncharacterized protein n=1 Tax=Candidatus Promineifilum breve TaxID=1806508 RepID=A0A160TAI2_9CHLR|nr:protein of unknown function [Candidatus Promineifilum breve]